jgi:malate/lactate dehydrogenase
VYLAERFAVSPACVEANVVGEHGTSSVFLWSSARIGGMGVADALAKRGSGFDAFRREVEQDARYANITIIEGLGASQYGVGMVTARVARSCCELSTRYSQLAPWWPLVLLGLLRRSASVAPPVRPKNRCPKDGRWLAIATAAS